MNSQIVKKESLIWIFLLLESYAPIHRIPILKNRTARWELFCNLFTVQRKRVPKQIVFMWF